MDMLQMVNECNDVKALLALQKNPLMTSVKGQIEARIALLKSKPKVWAHKTQINSKGGFLCPVAVYLDQDGGTSGIDSLIAALEEYKTNPAARPYSKG